MEFSRELLFFFSALGAFNGLLIGLYFLLFAQPRYASNYFLGVMLIALSIRIGKSVFFYFNEDLAEIFLQLGVSAVAFVGPSLYFYLKSTIHPHVVGHQWKYHFTLILFTLTIVGYMYPWEHFRIEWFLIFDLIYLEWFLYLVASGFLIKGLLKNLFSKTKKTSSMDVWILSIYLGNVLVWVAYNTLQYTSYIVGALSFSFIFYLLALLLFFTRKKDPSFLSRQVKYGNKKIDNEEAALLEKQLNEVITQESLFKDPNLKLPDLAERLNILPHRLSQFLNDNLQKNFTAFLNEYRIEAAKSLISTSSHLKLESIGYECGFNSKSTFYTSFKKVTGTTPAKYKEGLEDDNSKKSSPNL